MRRIISVVLLLSLLLACVGVATLFVGYDVHRDVSYSEAESGKMDIYIPDGADRRESCGAVLLLHGGSWSGGDKSEESIRCRLLAAAGYVSVSMNYTLWTEQTAGEYNVGLVLDDIDMALERLVDMLADEGVRVDKVAIAGYSAGAHLAMLYSYSCSETSPLDIAFTVSMAGPSDVSEAVWGRDMTKRVGKRLTGVEITDEMLDSGEADTLLASVSPVSYIGESSPPTLIMHGARDDVVPVANANSLISHLEASSVPYDYVYMSRSNHMLIQNPLKHVTLFRHWLGYCRKHFGY